MYPDELLRLDNAREIVLFRGQNPLMLYKIIPDELPAFTDLKPYRVVDYIPEWRRLEAEQKEQAAKAPKAPPPEPVSFVTQLCDQPSLFDAAPAKEDIPAQETTQEVAQSTAQEPAPPAPKPDGVAIQKFTYMCVDPTSAKDDPHIG